MLVSFLRLLRPRRRSDGFGPERLDVRPFPAIATALAAVALAAPGPAGGAPVTVLVAAPVGECAPAMMPAALWVRLVTDYLGGAKVVVDLESTLPDQERCRASHAGYAVLATFDRAPRLPGTAQDTDRAYAVARITVRNCATGAVSPTKVFRLESDPIAESDRTGDAAAAERQWTRSVRAAFARDPLVLVRSANVAEAAPPRVSRVLSVRDGTVLLDPGAASAPNQVLFDYADAAGQPHAPIPLVVGEDERKYVKATVLGHGRRTPATTCRRRRPRRHRRRFQP